MKKILLSILALSAIGVNAQDFICPKGFSEDFLSANSTTGDNSYGTYWWGKQDVGTDTGKVCAGDPACVQTGVKRTRSGNGDLVLAVTRPQGQWTPIGFSVGSKTAYVNLTNAGSPLSNTVEIMLTNGGPDAIEVFWDFISNGTTGASSKMVNADASGVSLGTGAVASGASKTYTLDLSTAKRTSWDYTQLVCEAAPYNGTYSGGKCTYNAGFDITALSSVELTVEGLADASTSWKPRALINQQVTIHSIKGGYVCNTGVAEVSNLNSLQIFPSPANDVVNVNFAAKENVTVSLVDIAGRVVSSQNVSAGTQNLKFNISNFSEGMYFVNIVGASGSHTEKLMVK